LGKKNEKDFTGGVHRNYLEQENESKNWNMKIGGIKLRKDRCGLSGEGLGRKEVGGLGKDFTSSGRKKGDKGVVFWYEARERRGSLWGKLRRAQRLREKSNYTELKGREQSKELLLGFIKGDGRDWNTRRGGTLSDRGRKRERGEIHINPRKGTRGD